MSTSDFEQRAHEARARVERAGYVANNSQTQPEQSAASAELGAARESEALATSELQSAKQQEQQVKTQQQEKAGRVERDRDTGEQSKREREPFSLTVTYSRTTYTRVNENGQRIVFQPLDTAREMQIRERAAAERASIEQRRAAGIEQQRAKEVNDRRLVEMRKPGQRTLSLRNYGLEASALRERDAYLADRDRHSGINHRVATEGERLQGKLVGEKTIGGDRHSIIEQQREGRAERVLVRGTLQGASLGKLVEIEVRSTQRVYEKHQFALDRTQRRDR